ncbi:fimbrial protein [Rosenbergiella epipactidis]|uniref:fimbrial protein n=1 Tax=Rosenbergiella epipactidis TaxID=1544694 RepID=UPI0020265CCF|nr:fimbrial protein [Rosenbergiella epipactidis]MCL9667326.1 fimbrial protein [Rosenbergiella epipactidis]
MKWLYGLLMLITLASHSHAACILARGTPTTLFITSQLITIDADAPVSLDKPFARLDSLPITTRIGYDDCVRGTEYGRQLTYLANREIANQIYATDIPGIGVKVLWTNGRDGYGGYPKTQYMVFPNGVLKGTFDYIPGSAYRLEFYKVSDTLSLSSTSGNQLLPIGFVAYNYLFTPTPSSYSMRLNLGALTLKSIPSCTLDSSKVIDFDRVNSSSLAQGIYRDLRFKINCRSDYQRFSTRASISTQTLSSDLQSIKVTDSAGQDDRLRIAIYDSKKNLLRVNGTDSEALNDITSTSDAEFTWQAVLKPGLKSPPAAGPFTAYAEIQFTLE